MGALLLFFINAVSYHPEWQVIVNRFVIIYVGISPILAGRVYYLKRKEGHIER